jgi:hypothetical protein
VDLRAEMEFPVMGGEKMPKKNPAIFQSMSEACSECGNKIVHEGGCIHCINPSCGWGQCG